MAGPSTGRRAWLSGILFIATLSYGGAAHPSIEQSLDARAGHLILDSTLSGHVPPVTVWYHRPETILPSARVVFLMHGSSRTGREARDIGAPFAEKHGFILLAPEFSEEHYPGDAYAFGNMLAPDRTMLPEPARGFAIIERVFEAVREALHLSTETYDILGHSAGGQFVQRLVLFAPRSRFRRAVASSPGRYAMPTMARAFPYGLKGSPVDSSHLGAAFSRDFVLVLGDRDTEDRGREAEAMDQGENRFARGLRFFATATEEANALKVPLAWRLRIASGLDHSPVPAVRAGFEELLKDHPGR